MVLLKCKLLGRDFDTHSCNKVSIVHCPLRISPDIGLLPDLRYQAYVDSHGTGQKIICFTYDSHATFTVVECILPSALPSLNTK